MVNALVVEDEVDIRNLLVEQLRDKGCQVRKANNGAVALQRVSEQKPDIIFVDIVMPVMDGLLFISELQESPETTGIPVVLVTAVSLPDVTMRAVELGVKYRLAKPWEQKELDFVFDQALNLTNGN
ncbi:MAG: response regulator [Chloroflexi bacterium]|nr:response regulator [Chloroflexota bacterium]MCH8800170.1 response regulator [Chloroflexota bacterium]MCH8893200.1 response regulator [Chloroflexota bacterium]MCH9016229.1 response regulator [Chloroflexota bacterium]MCI0811391.1 response regulator [Chloroflexota bacterium]